jgi:hypothetical protein
VPPVITLKDIFMKPGEVRVYDFRNPSTVPADTSVARVEVTKPHPLERVGGEFTTGWSVSVLGYQPNQVYGASPCIHIPYLRNPILNSASKGLVQVAIAKARRDVARKPRA